MAWVVITPSWHERLAHTGVFGKVDGQKQAHNVPPASCVFHPDQGIGKPNDHPLYVIYLRYARICMNGPNHRWSTWECGSTRMDGGRVVYNVVCHSSPFVGPSLFEPFFPSGNYKLGKYRTESFERIRPTKGDKHMHYVTRENVSYT